MVGNKKIKLLPEQVERLKQELEIRRNDGKAATNDSKIASEEDYTKELGGEGYNTYDPTLNHDITSSLKKVEEIERVLKNATEVTEYNPEFVDIGTKFELSCDFGDNDIERNTYILVEDIYGKNDENPYISVNSPIGSSVYGKREGEKFDVTLPNGNVIKAIVTGIYDYRIEPNNLKK